MKLSSWCAAALLQPLPLACSARPLAFVKWEAGACWEAAFRSCKLLGRNKILGQDYVRWRPRCMVRMSCAVPVLPDPRGSRSRGHQRRPASACGHQPGFFPFLVACSSVSFVVLHQPGFFLCWSEKFGGNAVWKFTCCGCLCGSGMIGVVWASDAGFVVAPGSSELFFFTSLRTST